MRLQGFEVNQEKLRTVFGISIPTIAKYRNEGMPYKEANVGGRNLSYNTAEVFKWIINRTIIETHKSHGADTVSNLETERARLARMQADRIETDLAEKHGQQLPFDQVALQWGARTVAFRAKLLAIPPKIARVLAAVDDHKEVASILRDEFDEALNELVRKELDSLDEEAEVGDDPAGTPTTKADTEPVGKQASLSQRRGHSGARKVPKRKSTVPGRTPRRRNEPGRGNSGRHGGDPINENQYPQSSDRLPHR